MLMAHLLKWIFQTGTARQWLDCHHQGATAEDRSLLRKNPGLKSCLDRGVCGWLFGCALIAVRETNLPSGPFRKTRHSCWDSWNRF